MKVEVYRNLHRNCWSVRNVQTGRVIDHVDSVTLIDATLVVRPAGRARVLRERRKNVHAFIKGTIDNYTSLQSQPIEIMYNPYKYSTFVIKATGEPVTTAEVVGLTNQGRAFLY